MQLDEFIETSLVQICKGIQNARTKMMQDIGNCPIAPSKMNEKEVMDKKGESIDFDVLVTISKDKQLDVSASVLGVGAKGKSQGEESKAHRIQFSVPFYPQALHSGHKDKK